MSGTFSQIYIQVVFAVKRRECLIEEAWEEASEAIMDAIKALAKFEAEVEKFM